MTTMQKEQSELDADIFEAEMRRRSEATGLTVEQLCERDNAQFLQSSAQLAADDGETLYVAGQAVPR